MKVFITGITGMIGSEFRRQAEARGWTVVGIARPSAESRRAGIQDSAVIRCDVLDQEAIRRVLAKEQPDMVIHLAAQAFNGTSWDMETVTHQINYFGTLHVLRAAHEVVPQAKVLVAGSSTVYGIVPDTEQPLREFRLLRPISPYGVTKVATENLGRQYFENYQSQVYLPRLFIHVGTGHPPATMIQNFARQLALIKKDMAKPSIRVGTLTTARDFIDVRDGVAGMLLLLEKGQPGEPTNICTGTAYSGQQILDMLIEISGNKNIEIITDKGITRPSDEQLLLGDNSRLVALGWKQHYTIRQTLEAVFADWMNRI